MCQSHISFWVYFSSKNSGCSLFTEKRSRKFFTEHQSPVINLPTKVNPTTKMGIKLSASQDLHNCTEKPQFSPQNRSAHRFEEEVCTKSLLLKAL
jgi:hypothetical protein